MTIVLVQCGARKSAKPQRAEDLYTGSTFALARSAARRLGGWWFILSAKYGLLAPSRIIAPYDQRLPRAGDAEWSARVLPEISGKDSRTRGDAHRGARCRRLLRRLGG